MRFSTVAFTLLGAVASASASTIVSRQSPYPDCANSCLLNADIGDCVSNTNTKCLCTDPNFVMTTTACIESACTGTDLQNALSVSRQLCEQVGVTLTSSAPAATSTTPISTPAAGTPTGATTSTPTAPATGAAAPTNTNTPSAAGLTHPVNNLLAFAAAAGVFAIAL